jgi:hypothetical protein
MKQLKFTLAVLIFVVGWTTARAQNIPQPLGGYFSKNEEKYHGYPEWG